MTDTAKPDSNDLVPTGIEGLDDVLHGGLTPYRLYLVEGNPGAGKTTLALQFLLHAAAAGKKALYVTLSETAEEIADTAVSHGWSLDGIEVVELIAPLEVLESDEQSTMFHPAEVELNETTKAILADVERVQPDVVVFDSLSEMRLLAQGSLRYRRQILALKQYFAGRKSTVLMLDDRTSEVSDMHLQSIAHGVLSLEQLSPEYGAERRRLRVIKLRGRKYRGGYHDFTIVSGGLRVFPRLVASEHQASFDREAVSSGLPELDKLLGGGLERGTNTLIMGPAGAGKSNIVSQYVTASAARGEKAVIFTFEESLPTLLRRAENLGMHLKEPIERGLVTVQQVDPAELSPGEFTHHVREAVEGGARMVVIDSLNGFIQAMPEERFLIIQLHELLTYLSQRGVVAILVVAQHGLLGSQVEAPLDASYLADAVILLRFFEVGGRVRQAISVVKKRSGIHERAIRELRLADGCLTVGEPLREFSGILSGLPVPNHPDAAEPSPSPSR